jgi:uridine kinase
MTEENDAVQLVNARSTVEVHLVDGRVLSGPRGIPIERFFRALPEWKTSFIVGAVVNSELRELTFPIEMDSRVQPVAISDADGIRIYRRSVTFLLEAVFEEFFPGTHLKVDYSIPSGGYFCQVKDRPPLSREELNDLKARMKELVKADLAIEKKQVPLETAIQYFQQKGYADKVRLLKYRQKGFLILYNLAGHRDYHHGYMVPSTGYLKWFDLALLGPGFILRFPKSQNPNELQAIPDSKSLVKAFQQYGEWLSRLGIESAGSLNDAIQAGRIREIILVSEALHEQQIAEIASQIVEKSNQARIVLIAGPSSSGKTTFSKRLAVQMLAQGVEPFPLEMDNYFIDRDQTPRDENGEFDFESLRALDTHLLSEHLKLIISGETVEIPRYNFREGKREKGECVRLKKDQVVVLEGIHGLNPALLPEIPDEQTHRVYASCLTQLNLDRHNRVSTTDSRLLRRIVRDARERGYSAQQTIQRWSSVRKGETRHIFPYQDHARAIFNSALVYEISALKPVVEPLLRQVSYGTPEYIEAKRLLAFLEWFLPLKEDLIPDNSILREFIGGSILKEFKFWEG